MHAHTYTCTHTRTHKHAHTLDYILMYVCKYVRCPGHGQWSSQRRADAIIQSFGALLIEHGSPCNSSLYCSRVASIESRPQTRSSPLTRVWSRRLMLTTLSYQKCRCNPMVRGFYWQHGFYCDGSRRQLCMLWGSITLFPFLLLFLTTAFVFCTFFLLRMLVLGITPSSPLTILLHC